MRIYFAHYWKDFGSDYEKECEGIIKRIYPDSEIINPRYVNDGQLIDNKIEFNTKVVLKILENYYYPEIDKCDIVVSAIPFWCYEFDKRGFKGFYSTAVKMEICYAKKKSKSVIDVQDLEKI